MRVILASNSDTIAEHLINAGHEVSSFYVNSFIPKAVKEIGCDVVAYFSNVQAAVPHEEAIKSLHVAGKKIILAVESGSSLEAYAKSLGVKDILTLPIMPEDLLCCLSSKETTNKLPQFNSAVLVRGKVKEVSAEYLLTKVDREIEAIFIPPNIALLKEIKRKSMALSIPIYVVSGYDRRYIEAGADDCIESINERAIEKALAQSERMKALWARVHRDDLTGLYKRQFLEEYLREQERRYRESGVCFSIMLADLDYFKRINDNHGHQAGDFVLHEFASYLTSEVRQSDIVARYGGEEFMVVFPGVKDARHTAERICSCWERKNIILPGGREIGSTFSAGLAVMGKDAQDVVSLVKEADKALYRAKETGRNRVINAHLKKSSSKVVGVLGPEGAFIAANMAASLTWQGNTVCLIDLSNNRRAVGAFNAEPQELKIVSKDPNGVWKKGGRPKELPGLLLLSGTSEIPILDIHEDIVADYIIIHAEDNHATLISNIGAKVLVANKTHNSSIVVKADSEEPLIISLAHLSNMINKARQRRVPALMLSPELAGAFSSLSHRILKGGIDY
ncbi:MAG: GGDEF domain-containing protein [Bacillota bacterium]